MKPSTQKTVWTVFATLGILLMLYVFTIRGRSTYWSPLAWFAGLTLPTSALVRLAGVWPAHSKGQRRKRRVAYSFLLLAVALPILHACRVFAAFPMELDDSQLVAVVGAALGMMFGVMVGWGGVMGFDEVRDAW